MKATFYLPAHPSYFDGHYTQTEIEQGIKDLDWFYGGVIFKGDQLPQLKEEFLLLREPGQAVAVHFDGSGSEHTTPIADEEKQAVSSECRQMCNTRLRNIITTMKALMEGNRWHRRKKNRHR